VANGVPTLALARPELLAQIPVARKSLKASASRPQRSLFRLTLGLIEEAATLHGAGTLFGGQLDVAWRE
jgi:hypothetical protein